MRNNSDNISYAFSLTCVWQTLVHTHSEKVLYSCYSSVWIRGTTVQCVRMNYHLYIIRRFRRLLAFQNINLFSFIHLYLILFKLKWKKNRSNISIYSNVGMYFRLHSSVLNSIYRGNPLTHLTLKWSRFIYIRTCSFASLFQDLTRCINRILNVASVFKCTHRLNLCF